MGNIFQYEFMRRALLVGMLVAVMVPCIGLVIVLKRMSMIGDALSHTSLAGVAAGLISGINPIASAIVFCTASALSIDYLRRKLPDYAEIAIAVMMSLGIGLAGIFSGFVKNAANFNTFLFGSIVAVTDFELILITVVTIIVVGLFILLYKELFYITFDESAAKLSGVNVNLVNVVFMIMTAVTVSVAARTVGALIVSSLMVLPVACAMQIAKSYKSTLFTSIAFALFFTLSGLSLSYYLSVKPGGAIVLIGVATFVVLLPIKRGIRKTVLL